MFFLLKVIFLKLLVIFLLYDKNVGVGGFEVKFRNYYDVEIGESNTNAVKREMKKFFDKASFSFNGFEKIESVPVQFPTDICILNLDGIKYAAVTRINKNDEKYFTIYRENNGTYQQLADYRTPNIVSMDCKAYNSNGYIALAYNLTQTIVNAREGSPIFVITHNRIRAVQYFPSLNLNSVYLHVTGNDLFLLQATQAKQNLKCPYYRWSGTTFLRLGAIPCGNARHLEPFSIDYENYIAVANYADEYGRTTTNSEIYKYDTAKNSFQLFQHIVTSGAVDVKYFTVPYDEVKRQHFLIFANSIKSKKFTRNRRNDDDDNDHDDDEEVEQEEKEEDEKQQDDRRQAESIFYIYDNGGFIPYQSLTLYAVEKFLPVQNLDAEKFLLLVACSNQDTKIYNLNDWKFEESKVQFTQGALSRGVSNMRIFQENDLSHLVIANALMAANETNIFLPIFKQDEHANALRQQIIDWARTTFERLSQFNIDKLRVDVEKKLAPYLEKKKAMLLTDIPEAKIKTVFTESLTYPSLHMNTNYWKALSYANQALDALESETLAKQRNKRNIPSEKISNQQFYDYDKLIVDTLIVKDDLKAHQINGINPNKLEFDTIKANKVFVTGDYQEPDITSIETVRSTNDDRSENRKFKELNIENLQVNGKINGMEWKAILNDTLKIIGDQFIKSEVNIKNLQADAVVVTNDEINGKSLAKLVSINSGSYVIDQDLQFIEPIKVKKLIVNERLNNIYVFDSKLDVLLKNSSTRQIIDGPKNMENIKVLEPITLSGRMFGEQLESIIPRKDITDTITLNGDYTITGDVIIENLLKAEKLIDVKHNLEYSELLRNGIRMDQIINNINITFQQPIDANDTLITFANTKDLQHLVKMNIDEGQIISGKKIFTNTLKINQSFAEVTHLNGVNVTELEERLFLKDKNQTIRATMQIDNVLAKSINGKTILLNNINYTDFVTKSGNQHIFGDLKTTKLITQTLKVDDLIVSGNIFNKTSNEIYEQRAKNAPTGEIFQEHTKFNGTIYVKNLIINSTINNQSIEFMEQQLLQLHGNIKYVGNYQFNHDINVTNLIFYGILNGIYARDFGKCWLQKTGVQYFQAPQTFATIQTPAIYLQGHLNGKSLNDFIDSTYLLNRNEHLNDVIFQNPINMESTLDTHTLNGIRVPDDMLYRRGRDDVQILYNDVYVNGDVIVGGRILNLTTLNGINLKSLNDFVMGYSGQTLYVENVTFDGIPTFNTLNRYDLKETLEAVWLDNENVIFDEPIALTNAYVDGLLDIEGNVNNMNLKYLEKNYISLTIPQEISTILYFEDEVKINNEFNMNDMKLYGLITSAVSNTTFNFNEFVSNTLKTSGVHKISGLWHFQNTTIKGNLNNVLINNLNLVDDVVHINHPNKYIITAPKQFSNVSIEKLYAPPHTKINGINMDNWIRSTVYVYENHRINGTTTIETVNFYNDLIVHGLVNNITFNEFNLLLRDRKQILKGNLNIYNILEKENRFLSNNIENLQTEFVNGINIKEFDANRAKISSNLKIDNHLIFNQPVKVEQYHTGDEIIFANMKFKRGIENVSVNLIDNVEHGKQYFEGPSYILNHFKIRQILPFNSNNELISFTVYNVGEIVDLIGITNKTSNQIIDYYRWDMGSQKFVIEEDLDLPRDKNVFDVFQLIYDKNDYFTIEKPCGQDVMLHEIQNFTIYKNQLRSNKIISLAISEENCFLLYNEKNVTKELPIYCLQQSEHVNTLKIYEKVMLKFNETKNIKQVTRISGNVIAFLMENAIEIWQIESSRVDMIQSIALPATKQFTIGHHAEYIYLAVLVKQNDIEIFRSINGNHFQHFQNLICFETKQLAFMQLKQSNDLLLNVLTAAKRKPLKIFQYKGVMGFQKIMSISSSSLSHTKYMQIIDLNATAQNLIMLFDEHQIAIVEAVLKML